MKIDVVSVAPDWNIPWQQNDLEESSGSGCLISWNGVPHCLLWSACSQLSSGKNYVLTSAHVLENSTMVSPFSGRICASFRCIADKSLCLGSHPQARHS
jgi:hypothetical protein